MTPPRLLLTLTLLVVGISACAPRTRVVLAPKGATLVLAEGPRCRTTGNAESAPLTRFEPIPDGELCPALVKGLRQALTVSGFAVVPDDLDVLPVVHLSVTQAPTVFEGGRDVDLTVVVTVRSRGREVEQVFQTARAGASKTRDQLVRDTARAIANELAASPRLRVSAAP